MATIQQCVLAVSAAAILAAADLNPRTAPQFRADDPLLVEVAPRPVGDLKTRSVDDVYDFVYHTFATPGHAKEQRLSGAAAESGDINTLGEVPDGAWYTNRHYARRMTLDELRKGPGNTSAPEGTLVITGAKSDGVTPGFNIRDNQGRQYVLKFDPPDYPELASASDMIGSKILFALGYYTPENYVVHFRPDALTVAPDATFRAPDGHKQPLTVERVRKLLRDQPRERNGEVRGLASRIIEGQIVGPFKYSGERSDDPNDIVPHENRRMLRGLAVFAAWMNHTDTRAINSLDTVVESDRRRFIRHYLIDFGSSFGSDSIFPKLASRGHVFDVEPGDIWREVLGLGIYAPRWQRSGTPHLRGVGHFESASFAPRLWKSAYPNPAFLRLGEADAFWAAKQVAAFTDEEIRAMVETAEFSDKRATDYVTRVLTERRDKIAGEYISGRLALDRFRVEQDRLAFDDLRTGRAAAYNISWAAYNNDTGTTKTWNNATGPAVPEMAKQLAPGGYCVAAIREGGTAPGETVNVYLRKKEGRWLVVGIERNLPEAAPRKKGTL